MTEENLFEKLNTNTQISDDEFRIGLVMAGAISAGAYTAGVMDFMVEALQKWEAAKDNEKSLPIDQKTVPNHTTRFDVLAGASAGGMCAGIFASALRNYQPGVTNLKPDENSTNTFYQSWVIKVDIRPMLNKSDLLTKGEAPGSVLNVSSSGSLEDIRDSALDIKVDPNTKWPTWLKDPLPILMSVNNLRGVPYKVTFQAGPDHYMIMHKDHVTFSLSASGKKYKDSIPLDFKQGGFKGTTWEKMGNTTLATGAFPAAFKPRYLSADALIYDNREYQIHDDKGKSHWVKIPPTWKGNVKPNPYNYWTVDGGTMNNEPFELARKVLADKDGRNARNAKKATRMVLMIDPFPNIDASVPDKADHGTLLGSLFQLMSSWVNQSRLKIEDAYILAKGTSSRFIIAPSKSNTDKPLASACLGAFGGLLDQKWRHHDYLLGRLNCQQFLKQHFVVHTDHRLVANDPIKQEVENTDNVRIIPLVDGMDDISAAVQGIARPSHLPWPKPWENSELNTLHNLLYDRIKHVIYKYIDNMENMNSLKKWGLKKYVQFGLWAGFYDKLRSKLKDGLIEYDLFKKDT